MADSRLQPKNYTGPDEPNSESVEGGPKTAEPPEEVTESSKPAQSGPSHRRGKTDLLPPMISIYLRYKL